MVMVGMNDIIEVFENFQGDRGCNFPNNSPPAGSMMAELAGRGHHVAEQVSRILAAGGRRFEVSHGAEHPFRLRDGPRAGKVATRRGRLQLGRPLDDWVDFLFVAATGDPQFDADHGPVPHAPVQLVETRLGVFRVEINESESPIRVRTNGAEHVAQRRVTVAGCMIDLTPTEYHLLEILARHAHRTVPTEQLLVDVWGSAYAGEVEHVKHYIWALRKKIEADPGDPMHLLTERGFAYRFE